MQDELKKLTVLVIDDHPHISELIKSMLFSLGVASVTIAKDGEEAYKKFCADNHGLIITDLRMEPLSGLELARLIRHDERSPNPYVPIIVMTGYSNKENVAAARDVGITEFLVKPFNGETIKSRLEQIIKKPRDFIDKDSYFGPDRRRRQLKNASALNRSEDNKTSA